MLAFWQQSIFRTKIDEKSHVFWDIDFGRILEGFWDGFGRPKSLIFAFFSYFFDLNFNRFFWKAKKSKKIASKEDEVVILGPARRNVRGPGER